MDRRIEEMRRDIARSIAQQAEIEADPVRGPIWRYVDSLYQYKGPNTEALHDDIEAFAHNFLAKIKEPHRYRLFHIIIGSTPPTSADLLDVEGEWSVEKNMRTLAEKHKISF